MFKKLILVGFIFLFPFNLVRAWVVIDEVKILPTEDRFIKLYNQDSSEVDLTNWYIQRKTQTGTSFTSLVTKTYFENKKISANGYFLISRAQIENSDIVIDNLTLTESNVIQLKNSSGEVVDKVCWGEVTDCGDSKISNPAPGQSIKFIQNPNSTPPAPPVDNLGSSSSSSSSTTIPETKTKVTEIPKIKTQIMAKTLGFVNLPLTFEATTLGYSGEKLFYGKYFWNFGDGDSKEVLLINSGKFNHAYFYPGDYLVSLSYYPNYYSDIPDATSQINIKIVGANISISRVGDEKDFFVELSNNTDYSADLSNWFLVADGKSFSIPRNTILASKKKMIISPKITNFSIIDKETLKLMTPQREIVFDYTASLALQEIPPLLKNSPHLFEPEGSSEPERPNPARPAGGPLLIKERGQTEIPLDNLGASVIQSDVIENNSSNSYLPIIISIIFIGSSACAVYFIRQKKVISQSGNDFEILDAAFEHMISEKAFCRFCLLSSLASSSFLSRSLNISWSLPFSLSAGVT